MTIHHINVIGSIVSPTPVPATAIIYGDFFIQPSRATIMSVPVDPKRTGVRAVFFDWNKADCPDYGEPGQAMKLYQDWTLLHYACPGCGRFGAIHCEHPKPEKSPAWDILAGSLEDVTTLTLAPSLLHNGCCGWHGYLRNGVFESC